MYMCARFPLADTLHPWMNAQVLSAREVPAYVRQDYWWPPESKLAPLFNATLPYIAAAIMPPILRTAPTVPVYHGHAGDAHPAREPAHPSRKASRC